MVDYSAVTARAPGSANLPRVHDLSRALVACVFAAHALASAGGPIRTPEEYNKVDAFVNQPLDITPTLSLAMARAIGKLLDEKSKLIPNTHDPKKKDDIRTFRFDGLLIETSFPAQDLTYGYVIVEVTFEYPVD